MKISELITSVIIFCLVATSLGMVWIDFGNNYEFSVDPDYLGAYNYLNETKEFGEETQEKIEGSDIDSDANDYAIVKDTITTIKTTFRSITWVKNMADATSNELHIPSIFKYSFITLFMLAIAFAILGLIFKKDV